jgi:hypothetical protein
MNDSSKKDTGAIKLDVDAWAVLSATVEFFPAEQRGEVLVRLGHPPDAWRRLALAGQVALFAAIDAGDVRAVARYGRALDETKRRLAASKTTLDDLGPRPATAVARADDEHAEAGDEALPPTVRSGVSPLRSPVAAGAVASPAPALVHPVLTLQQYACLRAECAGTLDDATVAHVHRCYGLDAASDAAEARAWAKRFEDRELLGRYKTLFEYYRTVLARRCG